METKKYSINEGRAPPENSNSWYQLLMKWLLKGNYNQFSN